MSQRGADDAPRPPGRRTRGNALDGASGLGAQRDGQIGHDREIAAWLARHGHPLCLMWPHGVITPISDSNVKCETHLMDVRHASDITPSRQGPATWGVSSDRRD